MEQPSLFAVQELGEFMHGTVQNMGGYGMLHL